MLLMELMESVLNSQSALDQLISNANKMHGLYIDILPERIRNLYERDEHDDMKRTAKTVVGRAKGSWFADNYLSTSTRREQPINGLKIAMSTLSKDPRYNVEGLSSLSSFVILMNKEKQADVASSGSQYVTQLELLPTMMLKMAAKSPDTFKDRLKISAIRLRNAIDKFYDLWEQLQNEWEIGRGIDNSSEAKKAKKERKSEQSTIGSQNSQVEMMISQILGSLDKKTAGEIRPIVAKSDNKLMTLQQEFQKRNIKM